MYACVLFYFFSLISICLICCVFGSFVYSDWLLRNCGNLKHIYEQLDLAFCVPFTYFQC